MKTTYQHIKTIGVTGGVGSGKSLVMDQLQNDFGGLVIKSDLVAHELMQPGARSYREIVKEFGEDILKEDGQIDRNRLAALVFADPVKLQRLSEITHPNVITEILSRLRKADLAGDVPFVAVEAAPLLDSDIAGDFDVLWYVYADEETRIRRLRDGRGYSPEKTRSVMEKQSKEEDYRKACQVVIDNSGSPEETKKQVEEALKDLLEKRSV